MTTRMDWRWARPANRRSGPAAMLAALVCVMALTASGCADKSPWGVGTNVPAAGATESGIGFSLLAENYTADLRYIGPTAGDTVSLGLAAVSVRQGNVIVQMTDSLGTMLQQQVILADMVLARSVLHGKPPYHLRLAFVGFSGVLTVGVGKQTP